MSEQALTSAIVDAIRAMGHPAWRNNTGQARVHGHVVRYGLGTGSSDVIAVVRGRFVAIEVKLPKAKPKAHETQQQAWRDRVNQSGGYAIVVRSVDEAVAAVREAEKGSVAA